MSRNTSSRFLSSYSAAADNGDENGSRYNARRNSMFTPTMLLVGTVPIFCLTLGVWQVQRLKWKIGLIDDLQEKLEQTPLVLPPQVKCACLHRLSTFRVYLLVMQYCFVARIRIPKGDT
jgi:hypothetical protein